MQKVKWEDKLIVDELKRNGYIFIYEGGAVQHSSDFGVDWRRVFTSAIAIPPKGATAFDPTLVEAELFKTDMEGWDRRKRDLKRQIDKKGKEDEYYKCMSRVRRLDLYALSVSHAAVFRLSQARTHGTTDEYLRNLFEHKHPTFVFYDDDMEDFNDWMLVSGLEAKREFYVCWKRFSTIKSLVRFIRAHEEDILLWDENYNKTMEVIRDWRALCRELRWSNQRKAFPEDMPPEIDAKLRETYRILAEAKDNLRNCESIQAAQKAQEVEKQIVEARRKMNRKNNSKAS